MRYNRQAAEGRVRLYQTTPDLASLYAISEELGHNAELLLAQSATGRASVISQDDPAVQGPTSTYIDAPTIVPLNATMTQVSGCEPVLPVPSLAPVAPAEIVMPALIAPEPKVPLPAAQIDATFPAPERDMRYMSIVYNPGLAGYAPPWGDSWAPEATLDAAPGIGKGWLWFGGALLVGAALVAGSKRSRRR